MQTAKTCDWGQKSHHASKKTSTRAKYKLRPRRFSKFVTALQEAKQRWPISNRHRLRSEAIESSADREFEEQKQAFENIPPESLAPYHGRFVAARNGVIVDSDSDFIALDDRILERYGDVPIYITKIGERVTANIPTIFLR